MVKFPRTKLVSNRVDIVYYTIINTPNEILFPSCSARSFNSFRQVTSLTSSICNDLWKCRQYIENVQVILAFLSAYLSSFLLRLLIFSYISSLTLPLSFSLTLLPFRLFVETSLLATTDSRLISLISPVRFFPMNFNKSASPPHWCYQ